MTDKPWFLGIDPGVSGGLALCCGDTVQAWKLDQTEADVADLLRPYAPAIRFALIEKVSSSPQMGVSSSFTFGRSYGFLRGLLVALRIPFEEVRPQVWQRAMGCPPRGTKTQTEHKNALKALSQQIWPEAKINLAVCDAMLIAEFGRRQRT